MGFYYLDLNITCRLKFMLDFELDGTDVNVRFDVE